MNAVVLMSGGLDSLTAAAIAVSKGLRIFPLSVSYGQRHSREWASAQRIALHYVSKGLGEPLRTVTVDFGMPIGKSSLTDKSLDVPVGRDHASIGSGIPNTYVPARNLFMVALASSYAEQIGASSVYVGFNAIDYSGYPDCRPQFVEALNRALVEGMKDPVAVVAPIIGLSKANVVRQAVALNAPIELSWSCYMGGEAPCGLCDSCLIRAAAFREVGMADKAVL